MSRPHPRRWVATLALLALLLAGTALADVRQELHAAYVKLLAVKSYMATMQELPTGKTVMVMEFQAPDRYRMTMPGQPPNLIIGDTMVMHAGGREMRIPLPKGTLQKYRNEDAIRELERGSLVEAQGVGTVGGQPARIYRHRTQVNGKPAESLVWVAIASGHVLQLETRGARGGKDMRILYSEIDSPRIRIEAPK